MQYFNNNASFDLCYTKIMKSIMCQHCEQYFAGETKTDIQMAMLPHYTEQHAEIMAGNNDGSKKAWMEEFDRRWDVA